MQKEGRKEEKVNSRHAAAAQIPSALFSSSSPSPVVEHRGMVEEDVIETRTIATSFRRTTSDRNKQTQREGTGNTQPQAVEHPHKQP
jgi:hypothetical protein